MKKNWIQLYPTKKTALVNLLSVQEVTVNFSDLFCRKSDIAIDLMISKCRSNLNIPVRPNLSDAKFRLDSISFVDNELILNIGMTDYLDYLCTNHKVCLNQKLQDLGTTRYRDPDSYLSNAIGNLALPVTTDEKIAILVRSSEVATFQGYCDAPGGHPEPHKISNNQRTTSLEYNIAIRNILFDSVKDEICEELNIDYSCIIDVRILSIIKTLEDGRKPEMIFYVPLNISSSKLNSLYLESENEEGSFESSELIFIDINSLNRSNCIEKEDFDVNHSTLFNIDKKMTVPTLAGLLSYLNIINF